jgi:hypothetical protein
LPLGGFVTPGHTIPCTIVTRLGGLAVCLDLAGDERINASHRREKGRRRPLDRTVHRIVFGVAREDLAHPILGPHERTVRPNPAA